MPFQLDLAMSKPTDGWERLGDRFYRKIQLYTSVFDEDIELENYLISGAPYSGALGMFYCVRGVSESLSLTGASITS